MMQIEVGKKYTSNGDVIRILCNDCNSTEYPVAGLRDDCAILHFKKNGIAKSGENFNLVEIPEPQADKTDTKISMSKKYLSCGKYIRIICTDRNDPKYPVVGLYKDGSIMYFTEDGSSADSEEFNLIEVWEPELGELCWFWNYNENAEDPNENMGAHVSIYSGRYNSYFKSIDGYAWDICVKFDGKLPEHLKGE